MASQPTRSAPESPTDLPKPSWFAVLRRAFQQVKVDELTDRAAALTYYGVQAIFPGVLVLVSIVGLLGRGTANTLISNLGSIAPGSVSSFLKTVIQHAQQQKGAAGILGVVGIVLALWSASGYVAAFMRASNRIYAMPEGRPIWKTAPVRLGVTLFTVVCLVAGIVIVVATGSLATHIGSALGLGSTAVTVWEIAKWPVLLILFALMLAVLYWAAPNVRTGGFRWMSPGAAVAVVIWLIASGLFALYVANFGSYNKTYGSLAGVIVFLVWLWISNLAILLGAEFDAELEHERALREGVAEDHEPFALPRDTRKFEGDELRAVEQTKAVRQRAQERAEGEKKAEKRAEKRADNGSDGAEQDAQLRADGHSHSQQRAAPVSRRPRLGRGRERPRTEVSAHIDAAPERVFSAMSDPWLLPVWVVGATHIRDVDDNWPAPGSMVHHQVGAWPLTISDVTAVVECEQPRRLVMQGRAWPFGEVYIALTVEPDGAGSRVVMGEAPSYGAARVLDNPAQRWLLSARNRECLARLRSVVENRRQVSVHHD